MARRRRTSRRKKGFGAGFLRTVLLVLLLAATGLFYFGAVVLSIVASAVLAWLFLPKISQNINVKTGKIFYLVILISLLVSLAACHFTTPTVFGGRDQGSIGTAAIQTIQAPLQAGSGAPSSRRS